MPIVVALLVYAGRVLRRPMDVRLKQRQAGPFLLVTAAAVLLALWLRRWPSGIGAAYFWGETAGVMAVYLFSCSLVLATKARWIEPWFGGLDRMYLWHKRAAVAGTLVLPAHVLLTGRAGTDRTAVATTLTSTYRTGAALGLLSLLGLLALVVVSLPQAGQILRLPYHRWLFVHRLTGLFVIVAVVHGLLIDEVVAGSAVLKTVYLAIGVAGAAGYAYDELVMRRRLPQADYVLERVGRPSPEILDLSLAPVAGHLSPRAGQFVFLRVGGDDAWREHPFTVAGASADGHLRLTIRSLGRDTSRMHGRLRPGLPATVTGPYGMFDYTLGRDHQVWIAGGIGIAPFLSWLGALTPDAPYSVDLFYSTPGRTEAVFLDELRAAEQRLAPVLRLHCVFTRTDGRLTAQHVAERTALSPATHVFLCGPVPMVEDLTRDLHRRGVPSDYLHSEHFSFR